MSTYIDLQPYGTQFTPINQVEFISTLYNVESLILCGTLCSHNSLCRTFDYTSANQCRLFEGDISTGIVHNFPQSIVGAIGYYPILGLSLFSNYNQTCMNNCDSDHYLVCNNLTQRCQCPSNTFWNNTFCVNQVYPPSACAQSKWCRQDLNITCNFNTSTCQCATLGINRYYWNGTQCVLCSYLACQTQLNYQLNFPNSPNWTHYLHTYTAFNTIAKLVFGFRNDAQWYLLDDVSVYDARNATVNLIQNGDFEQGNFSWNYSNPLHSVYGGDMQTYDPYAQAHSGTWFYSDGSMFAQDYLSQTFLTTPGHNYTVSYYIIYRSGITSEVNVTMWP